MSGWVIDRSAAIPAAAPERSRAVPGRSSLARPPLRATAVLAFSTALVLLRGLGPAQDLADRYLPAGEARFEKNVPVDRGPAAPRVAEGIARDPLPDEDSTVKDGVIGGTIQRPAPDRERDDDAAGGVHIYPMVFPVAGDCTLTGSFGDPRPRRRQHQGEDMMAAKGTPVVAAAGGTVTWMHAKIGGNCCALTVRHDDGWRSRYIHLNNDTPGTDDGLGYGIAEGIQIGSRVEAGTLLGWVGDSGNAERTPPHLHFELVKPGGGTVDPYPSLDAAALDLIESGYIVRSLR